MINEILDLTSIVNLTKPRIFKQWYKQLRTEVKDTSYLLPKGLDKIIGIVIDNMLKVIFTLKTEKENEKVEYLRQISKTILELHPQIQTIGLDYKEQKFYYLIFETHLKDLQTTTILLEKLFNLYITNNYDLKLDTNELIRKAIKIENEEEEEEALNLMAIAGVLHLRGKSIFPNEYNWILKQATLSQKIYLKTLKSLSDYLQDTIYPLPWEEIKIEEEKHLSYSESSAIIGLNNFRDLQTSKSTNVDPEIHNLLEYLYNGKDLKLDEILLEKFKKKSDAIIPHLLDIIDDEKLYDITSQGDGYAPLYSIQLLGELRISSAIPLLLDLLSENKPDDAISIYIIEALKLIIVSLDSLNIIIEFIYSTENMRIHLELCKILVNPNFIPNENIFKVLIYLFQNLNWEKGRIQIIDYLIQYGDKKTIPILEERLNTLSLSKERNKLEEAIRKLNNKK